MREMPKKLGDVTRDLWAMLVGTNGEGLLGQFKAFVFTSEQRHKELAGRIEHVEQLLPTLWTHADHARAHGEYLAEQKEEKYGERKVASDAKKEKQRLQMSRENILTLVFTGVMAVGTILAVVLKR